MVNIAAFIVHHLAEFRLVITVLAFVSGMMLNSWTGITIYSWLKARRGDHPMFDKSNEELLIIGGMGVIILFAALTAWLCWQGLANEKDLPNAWTFVTGVFAILIPIVLQRWAHRAERREARVERTGALPPVPAPPPPVASTHESSR